MDILREYRGDRARCRTEACTRSTNATSATLAVVATLAAVASLEPALVARNPRSFNAIGCAKLAHRLGKIVPDGPFRQVQSQ